MEFEQIKKTASVFWGFIRVSILLIAIGHIDSLICVAARQQHVFAYALPPFSQGMAGIKSYFATFWLWYLLMTLTLLIASGFKVMRGK